MTKKESWKRKSGFNPNRQHYLTADRKFYCYTYWDSEEKRYVTDRYEVGKDISLEVTYMLDDMDHDMDLNERYENDLNDPLFERKVAIYNADPDDEESTDPWNAIADKGNAPEDILFAEPEPENPQVAEVHRIIEEDCTDNQKDLFYSHFGMDKQLEELRCEEAVQTGKEVSKQAFTNRKNKIIEKVAKALGVERVKRCVVADKN